MYLTGKERELRLPLTFLSTLHLSGKSWKWQRWKIKVHCELLAEEEPGCTSSVYLAHSCIFPFPNILQHGAWHTTKAYFLLVGRTNK
jgi:hypothetical protein